MTFEAYVQGFGCLPNPVSYENARAVVLPIPLEQGCGEAPGLSLGPMAVLGASRFVETFEAELGFDPLERDVSTLDAVRLSYETVESPYAQIQEAVESVLHDEKFLLCLGGERTIGLAIGRACNRVMGDVGVVLVARRPGFSDDHDGHHIAPATIGRRLSEELPCAIAGPRFWNAEEARFGSTDAAPRVITARELKKHCTIPDDVLSVLPRRVLLSIDVGALAPDILPMPGNIEPGGLTWLTLTAFVDEVFKSFNVVCCDISGYIPTLGTVAPSVLVAQLALRCLGRAVITARDDRQD